MNRMIRVIDHTTGKIYESMIEASENVYVSYSTFWKYRKKYGDRFTIAGHDVELERGKNMRLIPIRCIETNEVYPSYKDAAQAIGVAPATISCHMRGLTRSVKGLHFRSVSR